MTVKSNHVIALVSVGFLIGFKTKEVLVLFYLANQVD